MSVKLVSNSTNCLLESFTTFQIFEYCLSQTQIVSWVIVMNTKVMILYYLLFGSEDKLVVRDGCQTVAVAQ